MEVDPHVRTSGEDCLLGAGLGFNVSSANAFLPGNAIEYCHEPVGS